MKNYKQDDDDYQPAKKTKPKPGPNSGPRTAQKPASSKAASKPKPRQRVQTLSPGLVGASAEILIPTPKLLNRPAKKINPRVPQHPTHTKEDFNWDIDDTPNGAAGPYFTAKKGVNTGRKKPAPKKSRFGPLELDSDLTIESPSVLKRNSLVSNMVKATKKTTVSLEKPIASVKKPAPRQIDSEANEDVETVGDSYPTDPKLKQNLGVKLTQALADCELLSEAPDPPVKSLTRRLGFGMQQQMQPPPTASVDSYALPQKFDPSIVDEHADQKPNVVGWNRNGPTNQGVPLRKKLLKMHSATVNEKGSPIVESVDPRLHQPPREVLDLTQLPDTPEFTSDYIDQSNENDEVMAEPTQTIDPRALDRSGGRMPWERFNFSGNNRSIPSIPTPAQLPESSIYAQDNFHQIHNEDGVRDDSVLSEDAVDLVPTQAAVLTPAVVPTQVETISKSGPVPIIGATTGTNPTLLPNLPTPKPTLQPKESVLPPARANVETLKSIAQTVLTSPDAAVPVKMTEDVAVEKRPILPLQQDPLKRRISWQEDAPSKKVKESYDESTKLPAKPVLQQQPVREQNDSQTALESQVRSLPKVQRMQPTEHRFYDQQDGQNNIESQAKPPPKVQQMKSVGPTSNNQIQSDHETRNELHTKSFETAKHDKDSIGGQSGPKRRAAGNRPAPKTFNERLNERFAKPAPPLPKSPLRPAVQTKVPQRQKFAKPPAISPAGEHRYGPERAQVPKTPPHQYTTERDMDVTLVESDTDEDEDFEEHVESIKEDQFVEYLSSDSAADAEEVVEHEEGTATPDRAPELSENQNAVSEALHKLADALTIRFCDKETAAKVPVEQFERGGLKLVSMVAEGYTDDLQILNTRLDADREKVSTRIEQMIVDIEAYQPPPARKNSKRVIEEKLKNMLNILDKWMESVGVEREEGV